MENVETKFIESQLHLEAMLYLLDDAALDREAFEARLANDPRLGEILAQSVTVFQSLESINFDSQTIVRATHVSRRAYRSWMSILLKRVDSKIGKTKKPKQEAKPNSESKDKP